MRIKDVDELGDENKIYTFFIYQIYDLYMN